MGDDGQLLPRGDRGEIVIRGSLTMAGYYKNPDATAEISQFGWRHTGDIGYLDDDNYLFIVDRAKDMIITGGFNVYSIEVENALRQHPDIMDAAVFGLPDDKWGERVCAAVQLHVGRQADPIEIVAFVKAKIGSVKAPKQVDVWPDPSALEDRQSVETMKFAPSCSESERRGVRRRNMANERGRSGAFCVVAL